FDSALPFPRWLLSIASHHCIDQLRRRRVEHRLFDPTEVETHDPASLSASPLQDLVAAERRDAVRSAVEALPERYRMPLVLRYFSEMSYEQIAGSLGLNRNHVATLIFRAKQELRRGLERQASAPGGKERVQ
ncbi:MAG: RNA polymerase sigma factor, partial [Candidatus Acidiferrales bacterium]